MTANLLSFSTTLSPVFIVPQRRAVSSSTSSSSSSSPVHHLVVTVALIVLLMFAITALCQHARQSVGTIPGDLVIGALFPVHHVPGPKQAHTRTCGDIREQYGIHRVEAAFQTIDDINKDVRILPNITLGIEVRDSCWYSAIALEQSIEFIRDAMAASDEKALQASSAQAAAEAVLPVIKSQSLTNASKMLSSNSFYSPISPFVNAPFLFTPTLNASAICPKTLKKVKNIVGVIGPASSSVTIQVQNLLQLFNIPQVGYSATSRDLSIKSYYKYFLRVVPSDWLQARVIANLVRNYNWTYISVVYTDVNYGSSLMEVFKGLAQDVGICIANIESVPSTGDDEKFDDVVRNLQQFRTARVVACFCEGMTVRGLLKATKRLNVSGEFLFVGSDGWADRPDVVEGLEREAVGAVTVRIYSPYVTDFDEYYFKLSPLNNTRNPWFREFWESKFNCSLKNVTGTASVHPNGKMFTKPCTGKENLRDKHKQDTKLAFVKKAIWTMAYGLHNMQKSECPNTTGLCSQMLPVNGSVFLQHLLNVSFEWGNETVKFDDRGDPPGRYDVMNYQQIGDGEYDYVHVGSWISGGDINISRPLQWSANEMNMSSPPESYCSKPCDKGQAKKIQSDSVKCCWICVPCRDYQYLLDEYSCQACPMGWWPNNNLTGCYQIPVEYIEWNDTSSLVAMGIACLGFVMTLFAMVVFIKHNDTPVVKASTRELSYVIMIGMFLCHGTTFTLLAKPTKATCFVSRVLPGISFAIMYSALVTKTNRIARILAGSKKRIITKKPRFMSGSAQVVITWILISIEAGIIATMLVREPADKMLNYPSLNQVQLICNTTPLGIIAPLGFDFFLIAMCTVYAVKTRNVPENFNEAKFIGFTMYTTLVIWIAFVPIYFNSNAKVITLCLCISFSAIVAIVLLFFPKIYIMLFKPEKNNRSYFTTAKNVRCHIGYVPTMGVSRHSSHSTSEFSMESPRNHSLDVHYKRDSGPTSAFHHHLHHPQQTHYLDKKDVIIKAGSGGGSGGRKQGKLSLFERFRISKQDKIAANVQQHIRAVRAAEALDRQTARVRRRNSSKLMPQRSSSSGDDDTAIGSDTQKMRLVTMLKQAYGNEVEKVPGFIEFAESAKEDCRRSFVDAAAQTSYDLLETWFPALRKRIAQSEKLCNSEDEDMPSAIKSTTTSHRHSQQTKPLHSLQQQKHFGITSQLSRSLQSQATINYAFDEQNSSNTTTNNTITNTTKEQLKRDIEKDNNNIIMTLTSSPSSLSKTANNRRLSRPEMDINNKSRLFDGSSETSHFKDLTLSPSNKWSAGRDRDRDRDSPQPALTTTTTSSASPKHRQRKILSNTMSSDESLLSGTSSLVIEESASSGGDSSPGSGIYKNIIINLGGILPSYEQNTTHSATNTTTANTAATNNNSAELDSSSTAQPWMTSMSGKR